MMGRINEDKDGENVYEKRKSLFSRMNFRRSMTDAMRRQRNMIRIMDTETIETDWNII